MSISETLRLATSLYDSGPVSWPQARRTVQADPNIGLQHVWAAACVADHRALHVHLERDPTLASTAGGPRDWEPLLYLCYSRAQVASGDALACARLLLDAGADPDAHWWWGGTYRFTALTGVFGEGESGPAAQPAHPAGLPLARLLLEAGADPNDAQGLYNRMFTPGSQALELLLSFGLGPDAPINWLDERGQAQTQSTLHYQLLWAVRKGPPERVRLLLGAGADPSVPSPAGELPMRLALASGQRETAQLLLHAGAEPVTLTPAEAFFAAAMAGEADADLLAGAGGLERVMAVRPDALHEAAGAGRLAAVQALLALGWDPNHFTTSTALHQAAYNGQREVAEVLLAAGADGHLRDLQHQSTPAQWAAHAGRDALAGWLGQA